MRKAGEYGSRGLIAVGQRLFIYMIIVAMCTAACPQRAIMSRVAREWRALLCVVAGNSENAVKRVRTIRWGGCV